MDLKDIILREDFLRMDLNGFRCQTHKLPVTYSQIDQIEDGNYKVVGVKGCCEKFENRMTEFINEVLIPKNFYTKDGRAINR